MAAAAYRNWPDPAEEMRAVLRSFALLLLAATAALLAGAPARAQALPAPPYYAIQPTAPLTPYANNPVQQQILQNYRTQLQQTQRELQQQSPSGLGRDQIEINRQLNAYNPYLQPPPVAAVPPASPNFNPAPFSPSGTLAPPFNAAH
jgi:hypothetical protein